MIKQACILVLLIGFPLCADAQSEGMLLNGKKITIEQCLEVATQKEKEGDIKEATRYLNQAAAIHWEKKEYEPAIRYFEQSYKLNQNIGNENGMAMISNNLGMLYADLQEYEKSLSYFDYTLQVRRANKEKIGIISALINNSVVLNNLRRFDKSAQYLEEALRLATEMSDISQMRSCYAMLAETYEKAGNQEKSLEYFNLYRTFHELEQRKKEEGYVKTTEKAQLQALLAEIETRKKELALSRKEQELNQKKETINKLDAKLSTTEKATRDLMTSSTKLELAVRVLEKENEIKTLNLKKQAEKLQYERFLKNILLGSILVITPLGLIILIIYMQKRKKNKLLALQNQEINIQHAEIEQQSKEIMQQYNELNEAKHIIKDQNVQLLEYNKTLEKQVEERTRQLTDANSELMQQNTQLEQYAFVTAHNLRGPVARILGLISILNPKDATDPINMFTLEKVGTETQRLDEVIHDMNQILEIQKSTKNELEPISFRERLDYILQSLHKELTDIDPIVQIELHEPIILYFIRPYLDSILLNLISNAIKYRNPEKKLHLIIQSQTTDANRICILIKDNGLGIDLSQHGNQVFGLYKRFHLHKEGKGIGLYLTKTQMETLGGKIEIKSQIHEGTSFYLYFKHHIHEQHPISNHTTLST